MQPAELNALERLRSPKYRWRSINLALLASVIFIVAVGLVPISWFEGGRPIAFFEFGLPFPPFYAIERHFYIWDRLSPPGSFGPHRLGASFFMSVPIVLSKLSIPLVFWEMALFVGLVAISGLSMYYLFLTLFGTQYYHLDALTAALVYMVNPFVNFVLWHFFLIRVYILYSFTPLLVALYIKGLQSRNGLKYASAIALVSLAISPIGAGLDFLAPFLLIITLYFAFSFRERLVYIIKFTLLTIFLYALVNAWWLFPLLSFFKEAFDIRASFRDIVGQTNREMLLLFSKDSGFVNLFRMMGTPSLFDKDSGVPWYPYAPAYFTTPFILIGFLIPTLAFLGLLKRRLDQINMYIGGLFVISLFLLKGAHPPFGEVYIWTLDNVRWAEAFRTFYMKFGQLLPFTYALLLGLGVGSVHLFLGRLSKQWAGRTTALVVVIVVACVVGVYNFPYWTGEVIPPQGPIKGGGHVEVPAYYREADAWLQEQGDDFRAFALPMHRLYINAFNWEHGYWGVDPSPWLFSTPVISRLAAFGPSSLPSVVAERLTYGEGSNAACLLGLLNVRYVMLHGDASWQAIQDDSWWITRKEGLTEEWLRQSLSAQEGLHWARTIGKLHFYENERVFPHSYATRKLVIMEGGLDALTSQFVSCDPNLPPAIFLTEQGPDQVNFAQKIVKSLASSEALPEITMARLNPTAYKVRVKGASGPFLLVFGESYHPGWIARVDNEIINSHFLVNGYANAWYIDKEGDYEVAIRFKPQDFVWAGRGLSALGLALAGIGLIFGSRRER